MTSKRTEMLLTKRGASDNKRFNEMAAVIRIHCFCRASIFYPYTKPLVLLTAIS